MNPSISLYTKRLYVTFNSVLLASMCDLFLGVSAHIQIHSLGSDRQDWTAQGNFISILKAEE